MERENGPAEACAEGMDVEVARILTDLEIAKARWECGAACDPLVAEIRALRRALSSLTLLRCATLGA